MPLNCDDMQLNYGDTQSVYDSALFDVHSDVCTFWSRLSVLPNTVSLKF